MADAFWLEDFFEWPTSPGNIQVGQFPGLGWSDLGSGGRIVIDTRFASGKSLRLYNLMAGSSVYTFLPRASGPQTVQWNMIRDADCLNLPDASSGAGISFILNAANTYFRVVMNTVGLGLGNQFVLQMRAGATGTFQALAATPNTVFTGIKVSMGITYDNTTGRLLWWLNDPVTPLYDGTPAAFLGLAMNGAQVGRLGSDTFSGDLRMSDFAGLIGGYLGPAEIRTGFCASNLALQDWTSTGGAGFDCIDQTFTLAPTTFIEAAASGLVSQFGCPVNNTNVFQIHCASHQYYALRTDVSAVDMNGQIGDGIAFSDGAVFQPPQGAYQRFYDFYDAINPNTGLAWQPIDLATNELGYERP